MAVPAGTPLARYGDRDGRGAAGEHDRLSVSALALSSVPGEAPEEAVIAASDLLIVPANVASAVRRRLERETDIRPESVIFNATHTHSGPGASTRGLVAGLFAGRYDRAVEAGIVDSFVRAIAEDALRASPEAFVESAAVRSIDLPVTVPPLDLRLTPALRLSPVLLRVPGISRSAWVGALRLRDLLFVGIPADLSGEIFCRWRQLAAERGGPPSTALPDPTQHRERLAPSSASGAIVVTTIRSG